ncbi:MAG: hypothetical protein P1P90_02005 [Patescibacteria group bacterium]|nr:hypothetical protein [Patescibacteria group bacterium]
MEIIPAILTKKKNEFNSRLKLASKLAKTVQIDIMDGLFVDNETPAKLNDGSWYKEYLQNNKAPKNIELHLMVINPWQIIEAWKELPGVMRIIWHEEVPINHEEMIRAVHEVGLESSLAINPDTSLKQIYPFIESEPKKRGAGEYYVDSILVMGVTPGFSGQKFIHDSLKTISTLHKKYPHLPIAVDGGVNLETAKSIKNAGANRLCAAGAIFLADNPKKAYNKLSK